MKTVDLHCDTVLALLEREQTGKPSSFRKNDCHLDLEKMKESGWLIQNMALFTDQKLLDFPEQQAMRLYEKYTRILEECRDLAAPVYTYSDIEKNEREGKISLILTLEDGGVVFHDLAMLRVWKSLGVRMIALVWNYPNGIGWPNTVFQGGEDYHQPSLTSAIETKRGLSEFGIEYVREMERLHIAVDVSHLSDAGFWDVVRYTSAPFAASHSNARSLCNVPRNLSDDMILAIAKRGGLIGINFCAEFLRENSDGISRIEDIVRHILYIKELAGIDCIAFGSDFDGIVSELEFKNASGMNLIESALHEAGLKNDEIEKIFFKNALNFWKKVLE